METLETELTQSRSFALGLGSGGAGPGHGDVHREARSEGRVTRERSEEAEAGRWEYRGQGLWETSEGGEVKR